MILASLIGAAVVTALVTSLVVVSLGAVICANLLDRINDNKTNK